MTPPSSPLPTSARPIRRTATRPFHPSPRRFRHQGVTLEPGIHVQRWCPYRGCYVIQSRKDPTFLLETPEHLRHLSLLGGA